MKIIPTLTAAALTLILLPSCDRESPETVRKVAELERQNQDAVERQAELERQLADQKLAAEMDAIERERASIEEDRAQLEKQAGEAAAAQDKALREREAEMALREGRLDQLRSSLEKKEDALGTRENQLTARDRELAGREALNPEPSDPGEPVGDYGTFYDSLSSYGSWFETAEYGYVWQPAAVREAGWRPYSRGRWVCSDRGWTWISEEPFGWATYHYGRWALLRGRGWIWVPGSEWAPSWVSWRENDSHVGWAPLPPETLAWRGNGWDNTVDVRFGIGAAWFTFVEVRNFGGPLYGHCLPVSGNAGWYGSTNNITYIHVRNSQVISGGPRYDRISRRVGRALPFYRLEMDRHPQLGRDRGGARPVIEGGRLRVSAPNLDAKWNEGIRPSRVRGRIDQVNVVRERQLAPEIRERFRQSRVEGKQQAEKAIENEGGRERFEERRRGKAMLGRVPERDGGCGTARQEGSGKRDETERKKSSKPGATDVLPVPTPGNRLPEGVTQRPNSKGDLGRRVNGAREKTTTPGITPERLNQLKNKSTEGEPEANVTPPPPRREKIKESEKGTQTQREDSRLSEDAERLRQDAPRKIQQRRDDDPRNADDGATQRQKAELAEREKQRQTKQDQKTQANEARKQAAAQQGRQQREASDETQRRQKVNLEDAQKETQRQDQARQDQAKQQRETQRQRDAQQQEQAKQQQRDTQQQQDQARQQQRESQRQDQANQQQRETQKQERAQQERAQQERAQQERAQQERAQQERAQQEQAQQEQAQQERAQQERVQKDRAQQERAQQERAQQERVQQDRAQQEQRESRRQQEQTKQQEQARDQQERSRQQDQSRQQEERSRDDSRKRNGR